MFLKAGSLNSNAIGIQPIGGGGLASPAPYCVRNCLPGKFVFSRPAPKPTPLTIKYLIQGTAVNGLDYTLIPDSIIIPANGTTATRMIYALAPPTGVKSVILKVLSPYTCSNNQVNVIDSATLIIRDSVQVNILNNDTTICYGQSIQLALQQFPGDSSLTFSWSPAAGLSSTTITNPVATPQVTTTYIVSANQPGAGCAPATDHITITVQEPAHVDAGPDRTTCMGTPFQFNVTTTPANQTYTYSWTPGTDLSSTTVANPTFTPSTIMPFTPYVVTADPGTAGCVGSDTVLIRVLPSDFTIFTPDTAICKGASVTIRADGDPAFTYLWTPTAGVSDPLRVDPVITPDTTRTYTVTGKYPTCPTMTHTITIDVQPNPVVSVGPDREMCQWDTMHLYGEVGPSWYTQYTYSWSPATNLIPANTPNVVFSGQANEAITLTVTTPAGCTGTDDIFITVHPGNFGTLIPTADTGICPRDSVQLLATGGVKYQWSPGLYLSGADIPNPVAHPGTSTFYTVLITDQFNCKDTMYLNIDVHPDALISLADSARIYPGESYQMDPGGNCLYFSWFPLLGLNDPKIANPVAAPDVNTRYIVHAATEWGCTTVDSIDVFVDPETPMDVPNAFSPGSQPNGEVKVLHRGIATLKYFRIFNRWGTKVFESSDINKGWDGTFNGVPQPMGVYVYMVEAYSATGRRFYKTGNITLIR